jgi:hypothetical protein
LANRKTLSVDVSSIIAATNYLDRVPIDLIPRLAAEFQLMAKGILFDVFINAMPIANQQGGFPAPFQAHVLEVVRNLPILTYVNGSTINVVIDFDLLGTSDDLVRAYHQGAKLASGGGREGYLWGPYQGQALKSENPLARYSVWNVVRSGHDSFKFGRKSKTYKLPEWASWDETMEQRIKIWGNKAPEWIYLQVGQRDYYPTIPEGSVFEDFAIRFNTESRALFAAELARYVAVANSYQSALGIPIAGAVRSKGAKFRSLLSGRYLPEDVNKFRS